jgi:diadenosine tetraphosphate (Ap4A) HIT family hydrolase
MTSDAVKDRCLSCRIVTGLQPIQPICETAHFHAHQDVAYPAPGQVIVALKRHVAALDELSDDELSDTVTAELLPLLVM